MGKMSLLTSWTLFFMVLLTDVINDSSIVVRAIEVGDEVCIEGFVMDFFCIDRGTLLDNPTIETLVNPGRHSVHCLVDVRSCVRSPFEILIDPFGNRTEWGRGYRLTEDSKQELIDLARSVGSSCSTCDGGGFQREGFRAVMVATILDFNANNTELPPLIEISDSAHSTSDMEDPCMEVFQMENILVELIPLILNGTSPFSFDEVTATGGNLRRRHLMHASLMMISWGFLLPSGVFIAKFLKHRPDGLWFKIHQGCQVFGLFLALIGWFIALRNFQVFADVGFPNFRHGICGMITMILGILQPINAVIRPHPPSDGEEATPGRKTWEIVHKGLGYAAIVMAVITIGLGTSSLPDVDDQRTFRMAYGIGCGLALVLVIVGTNVDKTLYKDPDAEGKGNEEEKEKIYEDTA